MFLFLVLLWPIKETFTYPEIMKIFSFGFFLEVLFYLKLPGVDFSVWCEVGVNVPILL